MQPVVRPQEELRAFLHGLMVRTGANAAPGSAILSCKLKAVSRAGAGGTSREEEHREVLCKVSHRQGGKATGG